MICLEQVVHVLMAFWLAVALVLFCATVRGTFSRFEAGKNCPPVSYFYYNFGKYYKKPLLNMKHVNAQKILAIEAVGPSF